MSCFFDCSRLRFLSCYFQSVLNEISIDEMYFRLSALHVSKFGYIPRVPRWISYGKRFRVFTYFLWLVASVVWVLGGACVLFLIQFLGCVKKYKPSKSWLFSNNDGCFVLALSSRVGDVVGSEDFESFSSFWITVPWAPLRRVPESVVCIDVFSLLSRGDLLQALRDAVIATYMLLWRKRTSRWVLQSYTAFRWFAVRRAIDKLPGTLIMTEHFDRWAVLVDSSIAASNRADRMAGLNYSRKLLLIQHGALGGLGSKEDSLKSTLCLPRKLHCVNHLYVYSLEEENAFKTGVLTLGCSERVKVTYFKPGIEIERSFTGSKLRVLFVGHPLCEQLHEYLFRQLRENFELTAYYKPHPMAPMSMMMGQVGWTVISGKVNFPDVDLLVSYPSTLVIEYEGAGVPAVVHSMNMLPASSADYLALLLETLANIKAERNIV